MSRLNKKKTKREKIQEVLISTYTKIYVCTSSVLSWVLRLVSASFELGFRNFNKYNVAIQKLKKEKDGFHSVPWPFSTTQTRLLWENKLTGSTDFNLKNNKFENELLWLERENYYVGHTKFGHNIYMLVLYKRERATYSYHLDVQRK